MVPSQRRNRVALLITAVLLTGCAEAPYAIEPASEHAVVSATTAHAHQLARSVAISLQDGNARFDLYRRMQNSEAAEGKVFLSSYLRSSGLDTAISRQGVNFVDLADNLPALEMYLPVPTHRKQWQGSEDLLVLAVTSERDPLLAYDVHGKPRLLSLDAPPAIPVLVIVPAESFDANGVIRARSRRAQSATPAVIALDHCTPEMITCDHEGDVGWLLPEGALSHRGIGVREWISHVKTPNDHEPWILGAPEFTLFVAGTSDPDPEAEFANEINISDDVWSGSDDTENADWHVIPSGLPMIDLDVNYGTHITVKCIEQDWDSPGTVNVPVSGSTTIEGVTVGFEAQFAVNGSSDDCGQYLLAVRLSTGDWTRILNYYDALAGRGFNAAGDLHWVGYGMPMN